MSEAREISEPISPTDGAEPISKRARRRRIVFARLLIGWIVLICAEVFSGASIKSGMCSAWTLLVTFWLYFAHFFFFTTLALRTGRTSFTSLYLWGVLFGLYESWITKVIWYGYNGAPARARRSGMIFAASTAGFLGGVDVVSEIRH